MVYTVSYETFVLLYNRYIKRGLENNMYVLNSNYNIVMNRNIIKKKKVIIPPRWVKMPWDEVWNNISKLQTNDQGESISTFGSGLGKYVGATLAPNGMIYAVPYGAGNILKINPNNCTLNTDPKKALLSPYVNKN